MIRNRDVLTTTPARGLALDCLEAGIEAADPKRATNAAVHLRNGSLAVGDSAIDLDGFDRVVVLGGGKAATGVVRALVDVFDDATDETASKLVDGRIVVPADDSAVGGRIGPVEVVAGGHPIPTAEGAEATSDLLSLAADADDRTLVLAVLTGGGSALLAAPAGDLTVSDLQSVTRSLLDSGADIADLNAVRKHCSRLKGGGLARTAAPARVVGILVSDVVGDDLGVIASGPTAPDETTYEGALSVLDRYGIEAPPIRRHLEIGRGGGHEETPKPGDSVFDRVSNHVVASNRTAVDAAADVAEEAGFRPCILSTRVRGEARESATTHVAIAEEVAAVGDPVEPPAVLLSGGETTVSVRGDGTGGPNLEFALSAALSMDCDCVVAAVDTDGKDGSTDAAGGIVNDETVGGRATREAARDALEGNDALSALDSLGATIRTGATGTNVNDLRVLVVPSED